MSNGRGSAGAQVGKTGVVSAVGGMVIGGVLAEATLKGAVVGGVIGAVVGLSDFLL